MASKLLLTILFTHQSTFFSHIWSFGNILILGPDIKYKNGQKQLNNF